MKRDQTPTWTSIARQCSAWLLAAGALLGAALAGSAVSTVRVATPAPPATGDQSPNTLPLPHSHTRRPMYILFQNATSALERQFVDSLTEGSATGAGDDIRVILLNSLDSPTARQYLIRETPTLIALAAGGREFTRRVGPQAITAALAATDPHHTGPHATESPLSSCRIWRGPRLRWIEESDPRAARVYRRFARGRWGVPDIFKAMSLRPDLMEKALDLSEIGHFSDGHLDRRTKERIATFVSALNGSHYCTGSHAGGLQQMGARSAEIAALAKGDLNAAALSPRDQALLEFVRQLTQEPDEIKDGDIGLLHARGWRDEQIFEAAFDAALFAFFNRIAITYGLDYPPDGWKPSSGPPQAAPRAPR
jgi:uncharacterized peroxidase-related enzyme